uniref:Uncharacterized protein n=1 Tax=viral metagenome TaxID=1070528 RepID=A0A6M3J5D7_9ZZZZ
MPHFEPHIKKYLDEVLKVCEEIETRMKKSNRKFNPWAFVQKWSNHTAHPQAILDALIAINSYFYKIKNPWPYGNRIIKIRSGNYYEAEHVKESEQFKEIVSCDPQLNNLVSGLLKDASKCLFSNIKSVDGPNP